MWVWKMMLLIIIALFSQNLCGCKGCWEEERAALLQLKVSINYPYGSALPSWEEHAKQSNCCSWECVSCASNRQVVSLSLSGARDTLLAKGWNLNASVFLPLQELMLLDLSNNFIVGWTEDKGCERLSAKLKFLEVLNLGSNKLDNSALTSMAALPSVWKLDLTFNNLSGSIDLKDIDPLQELKELYLGDNRIASIITGFGAPVSKLKKLEVLVMYGNEFRNASFLSSLGGLQSLKQLHLADNFYMFGTIYLNDLEPLQNLEELDLSGTPVTGFRITRTNGSKSPILKKLKLLNLSDSALDTNALSSLSTLPSLKQLFLSDCDRLNGSIHLDDLEALQNLEELDLGFNSINGFTTTSNESDNFLPIKKLYLEQCSLNESLLHSLVMMASLEVLILDNNQLGGQLANYGWLCQLRNLQVLDLSVNGFMGQLPLCLRNWTSVRVLRLWHNQFTGNIAMSPLINLTSLEYLSLSENNFEVPLSFSSFANHSKLKYFLSDNNKIIPNSESPSIIPKFQLQVLSLSNCAMSGSPPSFLSHQHDLEIIDLSHNNLHGNFPAWLLENNTALQFLVLGDNLLTGLFPWPLRPHPHMIEIDVSQNRLEGRIAGNISLILPSVVKLDISSNVFGGKIPHSIGAIKSLQSLNLSNNHFSGKLAQDFMEGSSLQELDLSNNNSGGLVLFLANLRILTNLHLQGNSFYGTLPVRWPNASLIKTLDMSSNNFSGGLPSWMNVTDLEWLNLSNNRLKGPIPDEYCTVPFYLLDLSKNHLSGSVPLCLSPTDMQYLDLSHNRLCGPIPDALNNSNKLLILELGHNNLSGRIPSWISNLEMLTVLILGSNRLEGNIPKEMCELNQLSLLDLSKNDLSGAIPTCLNNFTLSPTESKAYDYGPAFDGQSPFTFDVSLPSAGMYSYSQELNETFWFVQLSVDFTTKHQTYTYEGEVLVYMSGIDLSCNRFSGEIPPQIGSLAKIQALNLSHNNLTGSVPESFSNLTHLESLDLSYNYLNGSIPSQLAELTNLEVFSVAYNNLSGRTPDFKRQFATFDEGSYEGNPLLCGPPLPSSCLQTEMPTSANPITKEDHGEDDEWIDKSIFYVTFAVSCMTTFLLVVGILEINPHWQGKCFNLVEFCFASGYYFVVDNFKRLRRFRNA